MFKYLSKVMSVLEDFNKRLLNNVLGNVVMDSD